MLMTWCGPCRVNLVLVHGTRLGCGGRPVLALPTVSRPIPAWPRCEAEIGGSHGFSLTRPGSGARRESGQAGLEQVEVVGRGVALLGDHRGQVLLPLAHPLADARLDGRGAADDARQRPLLV